MSRRLANALHTPEPVVLELDGPAQAYFDIPLDYHSTPNGELEAPDHPEASRLVQKVIYVGFEVSTETQALRVQQAVTERLLELGGGIIWWRRRPTATNYEPPTVRLRLGTTPQLPRAWWERLSGETGNSSGVPMMFTP